MCFADITLLILQKTLYTVSLCFILWLISALSNKNKDSNTVQRLTNQERPECEMIRVKKRVSYEGRFNWIEKIGLTHCL